MSAYPRSAARSLTFALAIACAVTPAIAKEAADNLVPAGAAVDCIPINTIRQTNVRDDQTIDFITNGNKIYRNTLPISCPSLGFEKRFLYRTSLSRLCSVDVIRVLYNAGTGVMPGAGCGLGKFQPMQKAPK